MFALYRLFNNISKGCYVKSKPVIRPNQDKVFHNTVLGVSFNYIRKKKIPRNEQYETKDF